MFVWTVLVRRPHGAGRGGPGAAAGPAAELGGLGGAYRLVLFLPYAVPGFISILVFKGLFNQNLGEVNLILRRLFGIRPAWFSDPALAQG